MNLQTFKAATMAAAVQQVKAAMGHDAVILHTRTYKVRGWLPLMSRDVVEVTAGRGLAGASRRRPPVQPPPATVPAAAAAALSGSAAGILCPSPNDSIAGILAAAAAAKAGPGGSAAGLAIYAQQARPPTPNKPALPAAKAVDPVANAKSLLEGPAAVNGVILSVRQEMADLKQVVHTLVKEARQSATPNVPEALFDHYLNLVENHVAEEIAAGVIRALHQELRPDQLQQPHAVRERLAEHIERLVPECGPVVRKQAAGPHVLALIGPTGVGKTTTLAKLAANLKLKDGHKVGLITLDTYRIAAVDQLRRYAEIIGSPLRVVANADELRAAVAGMAHMDFVLIDTAGRSPRDAAKLAELRTLLDAIQPDDVHLVLSSTSGQGAIDLAYERFSTVRVDKMIFTKLDEAAHVGVVLNVCHKVNKALSYVTTGQDVPNDIEVGRGRVLARMILGGPPTVALPVAAAAVA